MKLATLAACAVVLFVASSGPALAGPNAAAVFALHAKTHTTKSTTICTTANPDSVRIPCSSYVTGWPVNTAADVYLVVARGNSAAGIAGLSCGVSYDAVSGRGVDVFGWYLCGDLEYPNSPDANPSHDWPYAGGGNRITWSPLDSCQRFVLGTDGVHAVAGCFYVFAYGADKLSITPNNNLQSGPELAVADCKAATDFLPSGRGGSVAFSEGGAQLGCNPCTAAGNDCGGVPVLPTTWGRIKTIFGD